jgi:hypothetical protein
MKYELFSFIKASKSIVLAEASGPGKRIYTCSLESKDIVKSFLNIFIAYNILKNRVS